MWLFKIYFGQASSDTKEFKISTQKIESLKCRKNQQKACHMSFLEMQLFHCYSPKSSKVLWDITCDIDFMPLHNKMKCYS